MKAYVILWVSHPDERRSIYLRSRKQEGGQIRLKQLRWKWIGSVILTLLVLASTMLFYRYQHPPVFVIEEPEGDYDIPTMQQLLRSLRLEAMMDTFGLESKDYVDCTNTEDEQLSATCLEVYGAIGMDEVRKMHSKMAYRPMILAQRDDPKYAILLWEDRHAINHCYVAEETDGKYVVKQHRRALGTLFEFKFRYEMEERS